MGGMLLFTILFMASSKQAVISFNCPKTLIPSMTLEESCYAVAEITKIFPLFWIYSLNELPIHCLNSYYIQFKIESVFIDFIFETFCRLQCTSCGQSQHRNHNLFVEMPGKRFVILISMSSVLDTTKCQFLPQFVVLSGSPDLQPRRFVIPLRIPYTQ